MVPPSFAEAAALVVAVEVVAVLEEAEAAVVTLEEEAWEEVEVNVSIHIGHFKSEVVIGWLACIKWWLLIWMWPTI